MSEHSHADGHGNSHGDDEGRISVEEHLADILATIRPLAPTELGLNDVHGLVLAEDVAAASPLPLVRQLGHGRLRGAGRGRRRAPPSEHPVTLPVVAEVAAGDTGAYALPAGHRDQDHDRGDAAVRRRGGRAGGVDRRRQRPGSPSAPRPSTATRCGWPAGTRRPARCWSRAGTRLRPMHIAVIAAAGRGAVLVRPRPRVVVLSTGNELAEPGTPLVPGRIWDSNSFMLAAAAREAGCLAYRQAIVPGQPGRGAAGHRGPAGPGRPDDHHRRGQHGRRARRGQGGAAAARHDRVPQGGHAAGHAAGVRHHRAHRRPLSPRTQRSRAASPAGSRTAAKSRRRPVPTGEHERVPIFTLPGNPVSAYVSFQVFARPAIGALQGYDGLGLETVQAELTGPLRSPPGRRSFLRGVLDRPAGRVTPLTGQGSHQIATLGKANALVIVPEWVTCRWPRARPPTCWSCHDAGAGPWSEAAFVRKKVPASPDPRGRGRARADGGRVRQGRDRAVGLRDRAGAAVGRRRSRRCGPGTCPRATRSRWPGSPGSPGPSGRRT